MLYVGRTLLVITHPMCFNWKMWLPVHKFLHALRAITLHFAPPFLKSWLHPWNPHSRFWCGRWVGNNYADNSGHRYTIVTIILNVVEALMAHTLLNRIYWAFGGVWSTLLWWAWCKARSEVFRCSYEIQSASKGRWKVTYLLTSSERWKWVSKWTIIISWQAS